VTSEQDAEVSAAIDELLRLTRYLAGSDGLTAREAAELAVDLEFEVFRVEDVRRESATSPVKEQTSSSAGLQPAHTNPWRGKIADRGPAEGPFRTTGGTFCEKEHT
jgi:hypothetical protein